MSNEKQFIDFRKEVEKLKEIDGAEEYAKQLAHLFLGNGLSLQTILLMAIDFGQQHPHWIPVEDYEKDELPSLMDKEDQYGCSVSVLFVVNQEGINYINKGCFDYDTGVWHSIDTGLSYTKEQVTHWMQLPTLPQGK